MISKRTNVDEQVAAKLLWQLKAIATKEIENIPFDDCFFLDNTTEESSSSTSEGGHRGRTVSVESVDMVIDTITPIWSSIPAKEFVEEKPSLLGRNARAAENSIDHLDHHDWGPPAKKLNFRPSMGSQEEEGKQSKRERESCVGLTTRSGIIRSTLRKKFSWKLYPELEDHLLKNQEEYFVYSSRNYTAEQRKYNNGLTRGLLDLASDEGYIFEDFTFSMVRDRIRCYYKSHSQSAKKKRRR